MYGVESVCCCVDREDRESRMLSSRMAIVAAFRSWSGEELHSAPTQHILSFYVVSPAQYNLTVWVSPQELSTYARQGILESSL